MSKYYRIHTTPGPCQMYHERHHDSISSNISNAPLFGETQPQVALMQRLLAIFTCIMAGTTLITACTTGPPEYTGYHVFMSLLLIAFTGSSMLLAIWYQQGDIPPKILYLLYFNSGCLNVMALLFHIYFGVSKKKT